MKRSPTDSKPEKRKTDPVELTDALIRKLQPPAKGKVIQADAHRSAPRGFGVRVLASGAKSFVLRYWVDGRERIATIGKHPAWSLKAARLRAQELRQQIDSGGDPLQAAAERKAAAAAAKAEAERQERYTLRNLCETYVAHLEAAGKAKSAKAAASAFKVWLLEVDDFAHLERKPAREVSAHDIARIIRRPREAGKARTAGVLRSYLAAAFNAARRAPFDASLPEALIPFGVEHHPVEPVPAVPVQAGDHVLSADDLRRYLLALRDDELADQALKLALVAGGQRMAQLLRAEVSDWNGEERVLRLLDGKGRRRQPRVHLVPLAPVGAAIVERLVERAKAGGASALFVSRFGKRPALLSETTPGKRLGEIVAELGCAPFNLRDVRRTVETELARLGVSRDTRAQLLSHGVSGIQAQHYDRHQYLPEKRAALETWERHLARLIDGTEAKVVPLVREG